MFISIKFSFKITISSFCISILLDAAMIWDGEIFIAASCPFVPLCIVHDPIDGGAEAPLAVVPVLAWAVQEVVVHTQIVAQLMGHVLEKNRKKIIIVDKLKHRWRFWQI